MSTSAELLLKTFPVLLEYLDGEPSTTADTPCSQNSPLPGGIVYVADESLLPSLLTSEVSIIVVHKKIAAKAKELNLARKTLLMTPNTYLAMALVNSKYFKSPHLRMPFAEERIHPTAVIEQSAKIGTEVVIGPYAVIGANVKIGDGSYIGANTVIETNSSVGRDCFIHPQVYIGHTCRIGDRVEIKPFATVGSDGFGYAHDEKGNHYRIPHYGAVIIENDVHIGANVNIDRGTFDPAVIGEGTKIDNQCHLGHNIRVGKNCLLTAGMIVAGSTTIGDNCVFGGRVSVNGHISIASGTTIGPLSGVTKDITQPGTYAGFPPVPFRDFLKMQSSLVHIPELRKKLAQVLKHLGLKGSEEDSDRG